MTEQAVAPAPSKRATGDFRVSHRLCLCQQDKYPCYSWCGLKLAPTGTRAGSYSPMEVCVICTEIRMADTVCDRCGLRPSDYAKQ